MASGQALLTIIFKISDREIRIGEIWTAVYRVFMHATIYPAGPEAYKYAADILSGGGLVALPTETVYGLAGDAKNNAAVKRIYTAKGRPVNNPLIAHILWPEDVVIYADIPPLARRLIAHFWPGPLTLVLPRKASALSSVAGAGLGTIAIRCPQTSWTQALRNYGFNGPVFMPSANRSGHVSPTTAIHVADDLGDRVDLIIDGGACPGGIESTVLKIEGDRGILLRAGIVPAEAFAPFVSDISLPDKHSPLTAPGMMKSHYAPRAKLRLNAVTKNKGEAYLAFGMCDFADANLSENRDLAEAAHKLYALLRSLDRPDVEIIAVAPIPYGGLGDAVNDRLTRAAVDRGQSL